MAHLILLVESDHDTRVRLRSYFEKSKFIVVSATNGADALSLLPNITQPSLVVVSKVLPFIDGETFISIFRKNIKNQSIHICQLIKNSNESLMDGVTCHAHYSDLEHDLQQVIQSCLDQIK